jgi:cytochrome c-type protein NapB
MRKPVLLAMTLILVACAPGPTERGTPDDEIGLSKADITEVPSPEPVMENTAEPGENPVRPRAFPGSPPVIPHGAADFVPITREENLCADCHMTDETAEDGPTPIPASHYTDLRNDPTTVADDIDGARYNCTLCHAAQTEAAPLVENSLGTTS